MITQRRIVAELMDDPDIDAGELRDALTALARANRKLGGVRAVLRELGRWSRAWPKSETIRIIDVGCGSADIPLAIVKWATARGRKIEMVAVDRHAKTASVARDLTQNEPAIEIIEADALRLMDQFEPNSFHYAHAGLFLHHLQDIEVLTVLRIMQRLASRGVIWNDLIRSPFTRMAIRPFSWMGPRVFRHDSIASMNAGFSKREAIEIAKRVGLERIRYRQVLWHRFVLTSEKDA